MKCDNKTMQGKVVAYMENNTNVKDAARRITPMQRMQHWAPTWTTMPTRTITPMDDNTNASSSANAIKNTTWKEQ